MRAVSLLLTVCRVFSLYSMEPCAERLLQERATLCRECENLLSCLKLSYKRHVLSVYYRQKSGAGAPNIAIQYRAACVGEFFDQLSGKQQLDVYKALDDADFAQRIVAAGYGDTVDSVRNAVPAGVSVGEDGQLIFSPGYVGSDIVPALIPLPPVLSYIGT